MQPWQFRGHFGDTHFWKNSQQSRQWPRRKNDWVENCRRLQTDRIMRGILITVKFIFKQVRVEIDQCQLEVCHYVKGDILRIRNVNRPCPGVKAEGARCKLEAIGLMLINMLITVFIKVVVILIRWHRVLVLGISLHPVLAGSQAHRKVAPAFIITIHR